MVTKFYEAIYITRKILEVGPPIACKIIDGLDQKLHSFTRLSVPPSWYLFSIYAVERKKAKSRIRRVSITLCNYCLLVHTKKLNNYRN